MAYVLDKNIINRLLDGKLLISNLPTDGIFIATHIQIDEINKTPDFNRRETLLKSFDSVINLTIPTHSFDWDVSDWHESDYGDDEIFMRLKTTLDLLNNNKRNNSEDCLIAEVAVVNGFTLISSDGDLCDATKSVGGKCIHFSPKNKRN